MPKTKVAAKAIKDQQNPKKVLADKKKNNKSKMIKKQAPVSAGMKDTEKAKRRNKPGTASLREIKRYQRSTELLLPRAPFQRLVREITGGYDPDLRFAPQALIALQEAAEAYLVGIFEDTQLCVIHAKRVTV